LKNKLYSIILSFLFCSLPSLGIELSDLTTPLSPIYRLGVGDIPENVYKVIESKKTKENEATLDEASEAVKNLTYADLSLKKIAKELSDDGSLDTDDILSDVQILWLGAAQSSQTIEFIVYKLSNPDEDKPDNSLVKKIIKPISTVGAVAGIGVGNPIAAVSSIMGSSILSSMSINDKDLNYKFSKVNDADMVVLIRKIEELQQKIVRYYFEYMTLRECLLRSDELVQKRYSAYVNSQGLSNDQILMLDSFYRSSLNKQVKYRSDFLSVRSTLEQIVGMDAMAQFEEAIEKRYMQNKTPTN